MRLICENCEHGYPLGMSNCTWCGCSSQMAHGTDITSIFDTECYSDYWLCMFSTGETFQMFPGYGLDIEGLRKALSKYRIISFNGNKYDVPIITLALAGCTNMQLKAASDMIIIENLQPWQLLDRFKVQPFDWLDHIDMFDVAPGMSSLKAYGGKMHSKKLQDLPIDPSASIAWYQRLELREYCQNDLRVTQDLFEVFPAQIKLREEMSAQYGVDLRSKSDAQIAEAVMKSLLPFKVERPYFAPGTQFHYRPPEWLLSPHLGLLARSPFTITSSGGVEMSAELERTIIRIGNTAYKIGIGGLHSMESGIVHKADDTFVLTDHDVASYYPSLILRTGIYPQQIGEMFIDIYRGWYDRRLAAKGAGDKKTANSLKTLLNGTFGKLGSMWSIFYAPSEMIQVTVTGQLALLMLIETLEACGIAVVSANTDGIVVKCRRGLEWLRDDIIKWWEQTTGFETEVANYRLLASRDVNNYVAIRTDNEVKLKGAYAPPEPGASGWPNPTGQICVDAVVGYLRDGVMLEDTVRACTDVRQFLYVRQVKGGGAFNPNGVLEKKTSKKRMVEIAGSPEAYAEMRQRQMTESRYLGKVVRWYYAAGSKGSITYASNGNLVPRSDGCHPLMELLDALPADIDYDWYIAEARGLLADLGVIC